MVSPLHFSFELFPPRTPENMAKLPAVIGQLAAVRPDYFSITYGAGGSTMKGTYETMVAVVEHSGVEAVPHLTCVGSTRAHIAELLRRYRDAGVKRIVALRGDLPATAMSPAAPGEFHYANELVSFIRETHGDEFKIEVAAYPEMHPQAHSPGADFENFLRKVEAGADAALTQLFYNADAYFDFMERCGKAGIRIPVVPGIMPPTCRAGCACALKSCRTTRRRSRTSVWKSSPVCATRCCATERPACTSTPSISLSRPCAC